MEGSSAATNLLKRNSEDIGWEYGELVNESDKDKVKCKLCSRVVSGEVHRLKQHVACLRGNVVPCTKSTPIDQARCKEALQQAKTKKAEKRKRLEEVQDQVNITQKQTLEDDFVVVVDGASSAPHSLGPMDNFVRPISPMDTSIDTRRKSRQQNINDALFKSRTNQDFRRNIVKAAEAFTAIGYKHIEAAKKRTGGHTFTLLCVSCILGTKSSEDCCKYGSENINDDVSSKAASTNGDARRHVEKEQEDFNRMIFSQILEPLRSMINGVPFGGCSPSCTVV